METLINFYLGREACSKYDGKIIKDLNYINRSLGNVIVIDGDLNNVKKNPDNVIIIPDFLGNPNDQELKVIIPFLKEMAKSEVKDVREVIDKYGNYKTYLKYYKDHPKYHVLLPDKVNNIFNC
jgi:import inner membrane translocase subunit TIM50